MAAALATWSVVPRPPSRSLKRLNNAEHRFGGKLSDGSSSAMALIIGLVTFAATGSLPWSLSAGIAALTTSAMVVRYRRRAARKKREQAVARGARLLSTLLRSGQIPLRALQMAAADTEVLRKAGAVANLGGDVAAALESEAREPGAEGMRTIAAAWRVSERTGAPVAAVLGRVAESLREQQRTRALVETELASSRTSGHMMAFLPLGAVGLGAFAGVDSLGFLFGSPVGPWLVCCALVLTAVGVLWLDKLAG